MDIEHHRRQLEQLERELTARVGQEVNTARDARDDQPEPGDLAQVDELKSEFFTLAQTDSGVLAQVRDALQRIADGTYGQCLVDGKPIDEKRLDAVPWTPYCVKHQEELEQREQTRTPS